MNLLKYLTLPAAWVAWLAIRAGLSVQKEVGTENLKLFLLVHSWLFGFFSIMDMLMLIGSIVQAGGFERILTNTVSLYVSSSIFQGSMAAYMHFKNKKT